jgi:hypothetical protein
MQVRLLGPVDVVVDGEPRPVRGLRRKAILAVLALKPDWSGGNGEPVLLRPCQPGNGLQLWNIG